MDRTGALDLLDEVQETLSSMEASENIKPVKVKTMLEHLRSALEYATNDTYDKIRPNSRAHNPRVYFPYGEQKYIDNFFKDKLKIPKPSTSSLYHIFNSIQYYNTGDTWLEMMCNLTNQAKHIQPIRLEKESIEKGRELKVNGHNFAKFTEQGDAIITVTNSFVDGVFTKGFEYNNGKIENFDSKIKVDLIIIEENKIKFHGKNHEVIPFIQNCIDKIRIFINNVYDELDKLP
ncbi:hypothetical protein [Raoultella ornithinolytica]|uniref:hypothetical protein n=1 Tax=Raoultella ornithinolytica TaxID=54291 RepID=UPI00064FF109|nr:hypothetical protein [Raoultella ornithinolytica]